MLLSIVSYKRQCFALAWRLDVLLLWVGFIRLYLLDNLRLKVFEVTVLYLHWFDVICYFYTSIRHPYIVQSYAT